MSVRLHHWTQVYSEPFQMIKQMQGLVSICYGAVTANHIKPHVNLSLCKKKVTKTLLAIAEVVVYDNLHQCCSISQLIIL